jgi:uncharacterized membrane protein
MEAKPQKTIVCQICNKQKKPNEVISAEFVSEPVADLIKKTHPDWSPGGFICLPDLNRFRAQYVRSVLETEKGELSSLEEQVMTSLKEHELLSRNVNIEFDKRLSFGDRLSDGLAGLAGSWRFIICFAVVLVLWIIVNTVILITRPFDPYPFILLNLVLSCLAAIQAPVILMSQNRQETKDRLRSEQDYSVNLKAELEIRYLQEKIDHLLRSQWQRLLQIQEIQTELMQELTEKSPKRSKP